MNYMTFVIQDDRLGQYLYRCKQDFHSIEYDDIARYETDYPDNSLNVILNMATLNLLYGLDGGNFHLTNFAYTCKWRYADIGIIIRIPIEE